MVLAYPAQLFPVPLTDPVAVFLTILAIMLIAPLLFEKLQLPGIVGLILAGVVVGPNVLGLLERDNTIILLGTVGLLFLMFLAGLETSLDDLRDNAKKAVIFGLATFVVPMILGTIAISLLGYGFLAAVLVASTFASHTLIALPILSKLGIMRSRSVKATLGATLITNIIALLVLAVVLKAYGGTLSLGFWLFLIPALTLYTFATLWGVPKLGRWFFQRFGHDESAEFTFVLATLFVVSYVANLIEIEPIIGAFLAGIAITQLIPQMSPLMNRIQFIGNTLFIPFFLISVGMLIDPLILIRQPQSLLVASVIVIVEVLSKFTAAWGSGKIFGLTFPGIMVMFGLTTAQAASTLAAATVAFEVGLIDQLMVNGIVAMILVTCIASPWITERWGKQLQTIPEETSDRPDDSKPLIQRVLVPVANPNTEDNLLQLALILAKTNQGTLLPLHVLSDQGGFVSPQAQTLQKQLLSAAEMAAHAAVTKVEPIGRVDDTIDRGIVRTAIERNATLIICGWKGYSTTQEYFFGGVIDRVTKTAPVPVLITRFTHPIENTQRLILAVTDRETYSPNFRTTANIANSISLELKADLQLILVITRSKVEVRNKPPEFFGLNSRHSVIRVRGNFVKKVSRLLKPNDLLILNAHTQTHGLLALPNQLETPETISRTNPNTSMMIIHCPK
ncbi:MAG: cation:proton antiporter [Spirulinaceae cyanobacterium]